MNILVVNCGSSSLSFKVYQVGENGAVSVLLAGKARNVATRTQAEPHIEWVRDGKKQTRACPLTSHSEAAQEMLAVLADEGVYIDAVGHRFVHGGERFTTTTRINDSSLETLREVLPLAPIHNPNSFSAIEVCLEQLQSLPEFVVFDTAFHSSIPVEEREYALPRDLAAQLGLRKYGFHGLSYQYVSQRAAEFLNRRVDDVKLIMCHLGTGGSSVCAFADGHSVATSMGFSPLAGLVMSTRCGDIDAEVALELVRQGMTADEVSRVLNNNSGLIGLSGYSSNLAEIIAAAEAGNESCRVAFEVYASRLKHYLGAYTWLLGGADAIVFTDDVGVTCWQLREKVCVGVDSLGVVVDSDANRSACPDRISDVSSHRSRTRVIVLPTDEERIILDEVIRLI